jgi:cytochrome c oxidase subunit 2
MSRVRRVGAAVGAGLVTLAVLTGCSVDEVFAFGWPQGGVTPQSSQMFNMWIGSTIFLLVSVLFYYTAVVQTDVNRLGDADLKVSVQASKWNWTFAYPGSPGPDGQPVSTVGDTDYIPVLVVPTGTRIEFEEHSADVIHSFWVPEMLFKRDVFPGNVINHFETTINEEGAYVGRCAELCGTYHSMMNFELRAVSPDEFQRWLEAKQAGASTPDALRAIGEAPFATTTSPFPTKREAAK